MKINYVKGSLLTSNPILSDIEPFFKQKGCLKIGKFDFFPKATITLMGKYYSHMNITGVNSFDGLRLVVDFYCEKFNVTEETQLKIDSISASARIEKTKNENSFLIREKLVLAGFTIKDHPKFPGISLKNKLFGKAVCVYFRSGKINFVGFKDFNKIVDGFNLVQDLMK